MSKPLPPIALKDLSRSLKSCHRIEDAIAARLREGATLRTLGAPPAWCETAAWERVAESMRQWATTFGNLDLYWQLRRKRDEQ